LAAVGKAGDGVRGCGFFWAGWSRVSISGCDFAGKFLRIRANSCGFLHFSARVPRIFTGSRDGLHRGACRVRDQIVFVFQGIAAEGFTWNIS
jgi:hypothetical protein